MTVVLVLLLVLVLMLFGFIVGLAIGHMATPEAESPSNAIARSGDLAVRRMDEATNLTLKAMDQAVRHYG